MPEHRWVDREPECATLDLLAASEQPVLVLTGTAGIGKTGLAVRWLYSRYTAPAGGYLYVDLSDGMSPADILGRWLRAWGCDDLPTSTPERRALFVSLAAAYPTVILLDDAAAAEQVWPLLATSPGCVTVITSEHALEPLTRVGADHLIVNPLKFSDTLALLQSLTEHLDTGASTVAALAAQCHGSPLAATMFAGQLRSGALTHPRPHLPHVKDIIAMSYTALSPAAQQLYRCVGAHPGTDLDRRLAAPMLDASAAEAETLLEELADAGLITFDHDHCRFRVATLVDEHMHTLDARSIDHDARARIHRWYLHTAISASTRLNPRSPRHELDTPDPTDPAVPSFTTKHDAMDWFDHELPALRRLIHHAATDGHHLWVWQIVAAAWTPMLKGSQDFLLEGHELAAVSAEHCERLDIHALMLSRVSWGHRNTRDYPRACALAERACGLAATAGNPRIESTALSAAGRARQARGHITEATRLFHASRALAETMEDQRSVGLRDRHLGDCAATEHHYSAAAELYANSAALLADDEEAWARSSGRHAAILIKNQQPQHARDMLTLPIQIMRRSGSKTYLADLLSTLADADHALGDLNTANQHYSQAAERYAATGRTDTANNTLARINTHHTDTSA